jgi:hypothetical protein
LLAAVAETKMMAVVAVRVDLDQPLDLLLFWVLQLQ